MDEGLGRYEYLGDPGRIERRDRIERWLVRIFYVAVLAAVGYVICDFKADIDEGDAVIEACEGHQTFECMRKAREEYRRTH